MLSSWVSSCAVVWSAVMGGVVGVQLGGRVERRGALEMAGVVAAASAPVQVGICSSFSPLSPLVAAAAQPAASRSSAKLRDGLTFPVVSFGLQVYDDASAQRYTLEALEAGYRNFFASVLAGNQRGFGRAVRESGLERSELFICGSVLSNRARGYDAALKLTRRGCEENLAALGLVPDQIMLDYPGGDADSIRGQWQGLEEMKAQGNVKSLALSNFSPAQLDVVLADDSLPTKPAVNQLPLGVGFKPAQNRRLLEENAKRGVLVQAWSPLRTVGPNSKALCADIGRKYAKSPQQIALKWILERGATFTTQTTKPAHFRENLDLFDFALSADDLRRLDAVEG